MTSRRRLVPPGEVREALELARTFGLAIGAVDIRADGVTIYPPGQAPAPGTDFDRWLSLDDPDRDRPPPRR